MKEMHEGGEGWQYIDTWRKCIREGGRGGIILIHEGNAWGRGGVALYTDTWRKCPGEGRGAIHRYMKEVHKGGGAVWHYTDTWRKCPGEGRGAIHGYMKEVHEGGEGWHYYYVARATLIPKPSHLHVHTASTYNVNVECCGTYSSPTRIMYQKQE